MKKPVDMNDGEGKLVRYWRKHKPIPDGWRKVDDLVGTHHGAYAIIIEKVGAEND